jgi:hypothetical protein
MGLSIRAYARQRKSAGLTGGTDAAVRKAIKTGRITPEPDGTVDPAKADRQWARQTDPSMQRGEAARAKPPSQPVPKAALDSVRETLVDAGQAPDLEPGEATTIVDARLAREILTAQLLRVRLHREKGELVDRDRTVTAVFDLARRERDAWLNWPPRVAANMAAELGVDAHAMEQVLDRHLRDHLAQMAELKVDLR